MKVAIRALGLLCAFFLFSSEAKADWLDKAASWSPFANWEALQPLQRGRRATAAELSRARGSDLAEHFINRGSRISTEAEWNDLFEVYWKLPQRQKHVFFHYLNNHPATYPVQGYLAKRHFYRSPKDFASLVRTFKYSTSPRATGATASNLIVALPDDVKQGAVDYIRDHDTQVGSLNKSNAYSVQEEGWPTYQKDGENYIWGLRKLAAQEKISIPYKLLYRLNLDPRIDKLEYDTLYEYDANSSGTITHSEASKAEWTGNQHRNNGTIALVDFIMAEISAGNAEAGVGVFLTRSPHAVQEMLRAANPKYYVTPMAVLLDAVIEENNTNPMPHLFCVGNEAVARAVANWVIDEQHGRYVAQMLPLMRNRQTLLRELKRVAGVDFTSKESPFTYIEEMAQKWGENMFGPSFKLHDNNAGNFADLLQRYADGSFKE